MQHLLHIDPDGRIQFVYDDALKVMLSLGSAEIRRASHVEPMPGLPGCWLADLSPIGLGVIDNFMTRSEALEHEVAVLDRLMSENRLTFVG